jgi:elongation factor 3
LHAFANNKKSGFERESAAMGFQSLATILGASVMPVLLPSLPTLFELYMDKGDVVRESATAATRAILKNTPPEAISTVFRTLETCLAAGKWRAKVGILDAMKTFSTKYKDQVAEELGAVIPIVENCMHDTKAEVSTAATRCATALCNTLPNPDLLPHVPALVKCMANPNNVAECIKSLSNTTFVAEVTSPSLAVLVPLLIRALNDRSMEVQRRTVVVIDNLVKLVRDPVIAARYLSGLVEGVAKIMDTASFPEVRNFASAAHATLLKAGASPGVVPPPPRDVVTETREVESQLLALLPPEVVTFSPNEPSVPRTPFHPIFSQSLHFTSTLIANLLFASQYTDAAVWKRCAGVYLGPYLHHYAGSDDPAGTAFAESARNHFYAIFKAKHAPVINGSSEEQLLCDILFSLAYGALLLLSHTTLRLFRGNRYGVLAPNGSGKSTLLRAIRDGKVENFPPQDELRAVMCEHSLQGEDASLSIIDFIAAGSSLSDWVSVAY